MKSLVVLCALAGTASADPEVWLRGSTHVHAKPSGDSSEPIKDVIAWYEKHGYDFIVLTDHNKVSELDPANDTTGSVGVTKPGASGLIVIAGSELTHNPASCTPKGVAGKCRIHANVIGATQRPKGKIDWANRKSKDRVDKYQAALDEAKKLGSSLVQINHPQWYWGMTAATLIEVVKRGANLMEIDNAQFRTWSAGDKDHESTEQLWDDALTAGLTLWGTASDDAHDYPPKKGTWLAGGAWIVVKAHRDAQSIVDAIAAGHFYASNGVELTHAEVDRGDLVVEVASGQSTTKIEWIENGKVVDTTSALSARRTIPASGYVRAVVTRDDGKKAWVQPARAPATTP